MTTLKDANNGWWHWTNNNPVGNQYWAMSNNELNLWKSHTVGLDNACTAVTAFLACNEYAMTMLSCQPNTNLATLPNNTGSAYGTETMNITDCNGLPGVPDCQTGVGAQNPAGTGLWSLFCHEVTLCVGCTAGDPLGGAPGFGITPTMGGSIQLPLGPVAFCAGLGGAPLAITYGTSGLKGPTGVGAAPTGITWDPDVAATGGHKTMFLFE